jgi:hypothetical protein
VFFHFSPVSIITYESISELELYQTVWWELSLAPRFGGAPALELCFQSWSPPKQALNAKEKLSVWQLAGFFSYGAHMKWRGRNISLVFVPNKEVAISLVGGEVAIRPVRLNLSAMVQCFSLTTKQHQPAYQPQKPFAEQPVAEGISDEWISEEGSL